jgi:outer membrane protein TolC
MKLTYCWVLLVLLPAAATAQPGAAPPGDTLTLDAALRLALENNLSLHTAQAQVDKAEEQVEVARTRKLPSFEVSATASQLLTPVGFTFPGGAFGVYPGVGPIPATDARITTPQQPVAYLSTQMSQPLTRLVNAGLGIRVAATERDIEAARLRGHRLSVVASVKRLYFAILQTTSALTASVDAIALYRELNRTLQQRVLQKVALRSDALDVEFRLAQEELDRIGLENGLASQKEQLNQLLGRGVATPFDIAPVSEISIVDVDLKAAQSRALRMRPDVEEARLRLNQAELEHRLKRADRIPEVSLAVGYSSYFNLDVLPRNLAVAGVQLKWEPFDWGRRSRELAVRARSIEQARHRVREAEDRVVLEINSAFRKLAESRALVDVAEAAQQTAREKLRVKTNQFQVQAALLSEVLETRADVSSANDRRQQALAAFWTAKANFEQALGEDVIP